MFNNKSKLTLIIVLLVAAVFAVSPIFAQNGHLIDAMHHDFAYTKGHLYFFEKKDTDTTFQSLDIANGKVTKVKPSPEGVLVGVSSNDKPDTQVVVVANDQSVDIYVGKTKPVKHAIAGFPVQLTWASDDENFAVVAKVGDVYTVYIFDKDGKQVMTLAPSGFISWTSATTFLAQSPASVHDNIVAEWDIETQKVSSDGAKFTHKGQFGLVSSDNKYYAGVNYGKVTVYSLDGNKQYDAGFTNDFNKSPDSAGNIFWLDNTTLIFPQTTFLYYASSAKNWQQTPWFRWPWQIGRTVSSDDGYLYFSSRITQTDGTSGEWQLLRAKLPDTGSEVTTVEQLVSTFSFTHGSATVPKPEQWPTPTLAPTAIK